MRRHAYVNYVTAVSSGGCILHPFKNPKNAKLPINMITSKAARIADFPLVSSRVTVLEPPRLNVVEPAKPAETLGWDPYEVWRTRVLLPRLQSYESAAAPALGKATIVSAK